jgi:hypothetical protein
MQDNLQTPVISGEGPKRIKGRFAPGMSGNPKGKPKGGGLLRQQLLKHAEEVMDKVVESARNGDLQASKLVLERILPALRPESMPVSIPKASANNMMDQGSKVIEAMLKGQINVQQGMDLMTSIMSLAKLKEVDELTARVKAIEEKVGL